MNHKKEVDLIDIMHILLRHKKTVLGLPVLLAVVTGVICQLVPSRHQLQTSIEIGQIYTNQGSYEYLESARASKNRLQAYGQALIAEKKAYKEAFSWPSLGLTITAPPGSGTLHLKLTSEKNPLYKQYIDDLVSRFAKRHNRIIETQKMDIKSKIANADSKIKELQRQKHIKNNMKKSLEKEKGFLKKEIGQAQKRLENMHRIKETMPDTANDNQATPLALMYFSNEMLRLQQHTINLNKAIISTIPRQIDNINSNLQEIQFTLQARRHNREKLQTRLENLLPTKALAAPEFSEQAVFPPTTLFVLLALVAGFILSALGVLLWETLPASLAQQKKDKTE